MSRRAGTGLGRAPKYRPLTPAAAAGRVRLDAVAFMAYCVKADPEADLWFAVDDIRVSGWRSVPAEIKAPASHWLEEWSAYIAGSSTSTKGSPWRLRGAFKDQPARASLRVAGDLPEREPFAAPLRTDGPTLARPHSRIQGPSRTVAGRGIGGHGRSGRAPDGTLFYRPA